jgi:hypothetical protein
MARALRGKSVVLLPDDQAIVAEAMPKCAAAAGTA